MNKNLLCEECDVEFRIKHDNNDEIFVPKFCPFCGKPLDDEEYDIEDEDEDA